MTAAATTTTTNAAAAPSSVTFDGSFSSFLDHLILLLAARFKAPLDDVDAVSNEESAEHDHSQEEAPQYAAAWELVAGNVRAVLAAPHTKDERAQLIHVDPLSFTPNVCRERALYLQWRLQRAHHAQTAARKANASRRAAHGKADATVHPSCEEPAVDTTSGKKENDVGPSLFDVTQDSIKDTVSAIFDAVRRSLPSTLLDDVNEGTDSDSEDEGHDGAAQRSEENPKSASGVHTGATTTIHDVFVRREDEAQKDLSLAKAREAFLTKVQAMQAEFFAEHHRWIDVPVEMLDPPATTRPAATTTMERNREKSGSEATVAMPSASGSSVSLTSAAEERAQRAELLAALGDVPLHSSAADALNALRRAVHVNRPARPSQERHVDAAVGDDDDDGGNDVKDVRVPPKQTTAAAAAATSSSSSSSVASSPAPPDGHSAAVAVPVRTAKTMRRAVTLNRPIATVAVTTTTGASSATVANGEAGKAGHHGAGPSARLGKAVNGSAVTAAPRAGASATSVVASAHKEAAVAAAPVGGGGGGALPSEKTATAAVVRKETAPPAGRRGRWQIVEYEEEDEGGEAR